MFKPSLGGLILIFSPFRNIKRKEFETVYVKLDFIHPPKKAAEWRFIQIGTLFL